MANEFKIQIPQHIVRNSDPETELLTDKEFVLLAKLIQAYYTQPENSKQLTFEIPYKAFMHFVDINHKRTFKECLHGLFEKKMLTEEIVDLPRKGGLSISLSKNVIPEFNKGQLFVQLESFVLHRVIIEKVGHSGIRILYYIMSYINYTQTGKDHCYASVIRMSNDLGISEKTFIKYTTILEKVKLIRVVRHKPETNYKDDKNGNEGLLFNRWNNHYYINHDQFKKVIADSASLVC
jgi:hypothetical protein